MKMEFMLSDCCYSNVNNYMYQNNQDIQDAISELQNVAFQTPISHVREAITQESVNEPFLDEYDFMEFWNKNYQNYYEHSKRKENIFSVGNDRETKKFNELDEILRHAPRLPSYLQRIEGKKMNFVMIATTQDPETITQNLENVLNKTEFQALPLSFASQSTRKQSLEEASLPSDKESEKENEQFCEEQRSTRHKRKSFEEEEQLMEKETTFKVKNGKKSRMSWITTKKTDLDEEDKNLEREIKMLIQTKQISAQTVY